MNIQQVLDELDELFQQKNIQAVEAFLSEKLEMAILEQDTGSIITIINELIGFYRDTSQYKKALLYSEKVIALMEQVGLSETVAYATTMLNAANAYRAAGEHVQSLTLYERVLPIYKHFYEENDFAFASYYNNLSLLYQEMTQFDKACLALERALSIVELQAGARIETATTHANLAVSLLNNHQVEKALEHAKIALQLFEEDEEKNFHYSVSLAAMGDILFSKEEYTKAATYYEHALIELESNVGRSSAYDRILSNLHLTYERMGRIEELKGLSLAREYYERYGKSMIYEKFPKYKKHIAVGFVGEGSQCYGFDDEYSKDHDFGPAFCMWVNDEIYQEIGEQLQLEYEKLPKYLHGISRNQTIQAGKREGVMRIHDFYERITGYKEGPTKQQEWLQIEEWKLATSVNGVIFIDEEGTFTNIRNHILKYYEPEIYRRRLAQQLALMAQTGQYNYARCMSRGDEVTARIILGKYAEHTMSVVYMLNKTYMPYYKWMLKGSACLPRLQEVVTKIREILLLESQQNAWENDQIVYNHNSLNQEDKVVNLVEEIAKYVVAELQNLGLSTSQEHYLEAQARELMK